MNFVLPTQPRHVTFQTARRAGLEPHRCCQPRRTMLVVRAEPVGSEERTPEAAPQETPAKEDVCKTCGANKSEMSWGCDGEGRIKGGIGSVPGFGWWPIKAYRECPTATKRGIKYRRKGQITDEVLFGRGQQ